jgi:light-regulated signal transduction histidine kinase (bacteriophytochrome)
MPSDTLLDIKPPHSPDWDANTSLAAQLERAKEDLELVAYAMSHDLKAPLRTIAAACEALSEVPGFSGNEQMQPSLKSIARESGRMKTLMQGLLDYLNLETFGPTRTLLDSKEIVATALTILEEKIQATGARITCDALPEVYGHRGRLTRLFVNMLDNALKFRGPVPLVHISARIAAKENFLEFRIEDNGIGIDEEYHTIIFQLFQRLHAPGEYPGEGIGLALCRKIVESHGGKLWVEPAAEKGSRFCFTLPATRID